jgi:hypothetical protein
MMARQDSGVWRQAGHGPEDSDKVFYVAPSGVLVMSEDHPKVTPPIIEPDDWHRFGFLWFACHSYPVLVRKYWRANAARRNSQVPWRWLHAVARRLRRSK